MYESVDRRTPLDDLIEADEADLDSLVLELLRFDRAWGERAALAVVEDRRGTVRIVEAADAMERLLAWISAEAAPAHRGCSFAGKWLAEESEAEFFKLSRADRRAFRLSRILSARLFAALFVIAPGLLGGQTESALAARLGVTRALISHYATLFCDEFGMTGRGMKSFLTRPIFAAAQVGNRNRSKREKQTEMKL
jgi:hypothetical protein